MAGHTRQPNIYPAGTVDVTSKTCIVHHAQLELNSAFPSSVIVTTTVAVTRSADALPYVYNAAPQAGTWYTKLVEGVPITSSANERVWAVGNGAGARLEVYRTATGYTALLHNGTSSVTSAVAITPTIGNTVELRLSVSITGVLTLYCSVNGAAEVAGVASGALTLPSAYAALVLTLNADGALGNLGYGAYQALRQSSAIQSLAQMQGA